MVEIVCGDAREVLAATAAGSFNFILADPPFNLGKHYGAGVDDAMPEDLYDLFLYRLYQEAWNVAAADSVLYAFSSPRQRCMVERLLEQSEWEYCQRLVWYRPNGMQRSRADKRIWACLTEEIHYVRKGAGLKSALRMPWYHDVLTIPTPQSNHRAGRWHVAQKPVKLYKLLLQAHEGITRVLDPTCGSGSALVACVELGIDALGIELNPETAELARARVKAAEDSVRYRQARQGQEPLWPAGAAARP